MLFKIPHSKYIYLILPICRHQHKLMRAISNERMLSDFDRKYADIWCCHIWNIRLYSGKCDTLMLLLCNRLAVMFKYYFVIRKIQYITYLYDECSTKAQDEESESLYVKAHPLSQGFGLARRTRSVYRRIKEIPIGCNLQTTMAMSLIENQ